MNGESHMGLTKRERRGLIGIVIAAVVTAVIAYYYMQSAWALAVGLLVGAAGAAARWSGRWVAHRDRFGFGTVLCLGLGALMIYSLVQEIRLSSRAVPGVARVEQYNPIGRTAEVVHEVEGLPVRATLKGVSRFWPPKQDSEVPIRFLPEDPAHVELNRGWERYMWPVILGLLF